MSNLEYEFSEENSTRMTRKKRIGTDLTYISGLNLIRVNPLMIRLIRVLFFFRTERRSGLELLVGLVT
jgi:hypothetical protein